MGFFSKILAKLGIGGADAAPTPENADPSDIDKPGHGAGCTTSPQPDRSRRVQQLEQRAAATRRN